MEDDRPLEESDLEEDKRAKEVEEDDARDEVEGEVPGEEA